MATISTSRAKNMAKTKAQQTADIAAKAAVAALQNPDQVLIDEDTDEELTDAFAALRDMDPSGGKAVWQVICVKKYPYRKEREGYVETIGVEQLNMEHFVNQYGGGVYRLVGMVESRYVKGLNKKITVAETGKEGRHWETTDTDNPSSGVGPVNLITKLEQQRLDREAADRRAASDRMKDWIGLAAALAPIGAAFIARKPAFDPMALVVAMQAGQPKFTDMVAMLNATKEKEGPGSLEAVLKLLEVFQDKLGGGAAGESNWIDLAREAVREVLPAARPILEQLAQQRAQTQQANLQPMVVQPLTNPMLPAASATAPTGTTSNGSPASAPTSNPIPEDDMLTLLKPFLIRKCEDLLEAARENRSVELTAEWLLESIPKIYRAQVSAQQLRDLIGRADWWPIVSQFYPQLQPYQAWLDDVRSEVLGMLEEEVSQPGNVPEAGASVQ